MDAKVLLESIATLLGSLTQYAWIALIVALTCRYHKQLMMILESFTKFSVAGLSVERKLNSTAQGEAIAELTNNIKAPAVSRDFHLYWLGHDIVFAQNVILQNPDASQILFAFRLVEHHALHFLQNESVNKLLQIIRETKAITVWNEDVRRKYFRALQDVKLELGKSFTNS